MGQRQEVVEWDRYIRSDTFDTFPNENDFSYDIFFYLQDMLKLDTSILWFIVYGKLIK